MAFYQLVYNQTIKSGIDEVWDFISDPRNLKSITPDYMGFDITSKDVPEYMYEGLIISYTVSPFLGIKSDWVTEITHIKEKVFFVDEQRIGPYKFWHHQHMFSESDEGMVMRDIVTYEPPFGPLGAFANMLLIDKKLRNIFSFRQNYINKLFT